jgi:hypothetical protein
MLHRQATFLVVPAIAALLGACAASQATAQTVVTAPVQLAPSTVIVAPSAPPAPQTETVPPPPASATVVSYWQPGHWDWNGSSWVWVEGSYIQRVLQPTATAVWVPGQWVMQASGGYVWVAGHWQT